MRTLAFLTVAVAMSCGTPGVGGTDAGNSPRIAVYPLRVDFGVDAGMPVAIGSIGTATLTIKNNGTGTLVMSNVALTGDPAFTATRPTEMSLGPDAGSDLTVTFSPMEARVHTGQIQITSNAKNVPTAGVNVMGLGKTP